MTKEKNYVELQCDQKKRNAHSDYTDQLNIININN